MRFSTPLALCLLVSSIGPLPAAADAPAQAEAPAVKHPLRGVVREIKAERSALVVKHEEIPGVMRAMTMLFVVSAEDLAKVKAGDQITGLMSRRGRDWVLEEIRVVPSSS